MTIPTFQLAAPVYNRHWHNMIVETHLIQSLDKTVKRLFEGEDRYAYVSKITQVPIPVIAAIHEREASGSFTCWLHNGDQMERDGKPAQTVDVPAGRPPNPACSWEDGAVDALKGDELTALGTWTIARICYALEAYNGWGYWERGVPSPYLWSWSNQYSAGKFVRDGVYSHTAVDHQIGAMVIVRRMMELDPTLAIKGD
jgi:lysozyme family protein